MLNLAPDYMEYGSQNQDNCTLTTCNASEIYYLLSGIMVGMPIFGLIYLVFSWIFCFVFVLSFFYNIYRTPVTKYDLLMEDDDVVKY